MNEQYHIMIVDDEEDMTELISSYLKREKYQVSVAKNGFELLEILEQEDFSLIILDIMMPYMDGFTACQMVRKYSQVPIIMLTAKGDDRDQIHGLQMGADDYIVKPFSPKQLIARIEALLRRSNNTFEKTFLQIANIVLDVDGRTVKVNSELVSLTRKEYDLLYLLMNNKRRVFPREQIYNIIWGNNEHASGSIRTVDTHVKTLRLKLGKSGQYIETIWGVGYKLEDRSHAKL